MASNASSDSGTQTPSVDNISLSQVSYSKQSRSNTHTNVQQATSMSTKENGNGAAEMKIDLNVKGAWDDPNTGTVLYKCAPMAPISLLTPLAGLMNEQTKIILSFSQQEDENVIAESDVMECENTNLNGDAKGNGVGNGEGNGDDDAKTDVVFLELPDLSQLVQHRARSLSVPVCDLNYMLLCVFCTLLCRQQHKQIMAFCI